MIDNIKNLGTGAQFKTQDNAKREVGVKTGDSSSSAVPSSASSTSNSDVQLSSDALKLEGIKKTILSAPDTDEAKVERIKGEIARGEYKIGLENLAQKIVDGFAKKGL